MFNQFSPVDFFQPLLDRENSRVQRNNERATKASLPATLTLPQWLAIIHHYRWSCAYCRGPYESIDHIIPIALGGGTTAHNCVPACHVCNGKRQKFVNQTLNARATLAQVAA